MFTSRFTNGVLGLFELSRVSSGGGGMIFELHGIKGSVCWYKNKINELQVYIPGKIVDEWRYKKIVTTEVLPFDYKWDYGFTQSGSFTLLFHDYLSSKGKAPALGDGLKYCEIIDAVTKSDLKNKQYLIEILNFEKYIYKVSCQVKCHEKTE